MERPPPPARRVVAQSVNESCQPPSLTRARRKACWHLLPLLIGFVVIFWLTDKPRHGLLHVQRYFILK